MIIRKAMYGCGLYFFIQLAYNSPILCKFADGMLFFAKNHFPMQHIGLIVYQCFEN